MTLSLNNCGPVGLAKSVLEGMPVLMIPAVILVLACGPSFVASPLTKNGCDNGQQVAVAADGKVAWASPVGEREFTVANAVKPKNVCITELDKEQAAAFDTSQKLSWADFNSWKAKQGG